MTDHPCHPYAVGTSRLEQWTWLVWALESSPHPHNVILDIGAGWGKGERLLMEMLNVKPLTIVAVEANPMLAISLKGRSGYAQVWEMDATDLTDEMLARFDTVVFADVIEHLESNEVRALLAKIPGQVVISTPVDAQVGIDWTGTPELEVHRTQWSPADFSDHFSMNGGHALEYVKHWEPAPGQGQGAGQWIIRLGPRVARP